MAQRFFIVNTDIGERKVCEFDFWLGQIYHILSMAYLRIQKMGAKFRWSHKEGRGKLSFPNFSNGAKKICQWGHGPMPPKYAIVSHVHYWVPLGFLWCIWLGATTTKLNIIIIIIIISLTSIFFQDKSRVWTAASQQH